ncbi:MAG: sigma-54-dependent Fis family transcriptional regulator [Kofleriaceae bacterium]|nr:sigma-54-dependent Fis family transcriptional regulator [Kofleriaceae bacterium]MBP6839950.1 sigma-54-dependent Fis family transcriptional regulator [Kofleriaceae bacterium]
MEPVLLADAPSWLWTRFHDHAARVEVPRVFAPVVERWQRARGLGASAEGAAPEEHLLRGDALRAHADRASALTRAAEATLTEASGLLASRGYLLLLADADGVVVHTSGGGDFADEARRVRLIDGACWSEAARGTNAIGTALAEACPTVVTGGAHYGRAFHNLVCYAAPVCGPDGRVLGVLDATSTVDRADDLIGFTITSAARALEGVLRQGAYAHAGSAVSRALTRSLERVPGPVVLIEAPGRVAHGNDAARARFGAGLVGATARGLLGLGWAELCAEAARPSAGGRPIVLRLAGGNRGARLRVDPIAAHDGATIAVVAYLEADEPLRRPRSEARAVEPAGATASAGAGADAAFARLYAGDPALRAALTFARRVAPSTVPVMLLAETGSGKELVAGAIHAASVRARGPFVAVNCGAISPALLESELFGYGAGAFTGASPSGRVGYLAEASGGTLFLDEVAEMPPAMQASLLRVLEDGTYRRVGESHTTRADVRIITATCRDLPAMVEGGRFRQDLYFRLKGATLVLPPLRARTDRVGLAHHLLGELAARRGQPAPALSPALQAWIGAQPWPGNVRELKSVLDVALVLADGDDPLDLHHLPPDPLAATAPAPALPALPRGDGGDGPARLDEVEAEVVRRALDAEGGNVSSVAARLGVARSTVYRMLRRAGLRPPR